MTLEVETLLAVTLMMAVFSAVAAVGTSIVLGAGFERLRSGFEVIRKQTGFFSDAIHKLEKKVEVVNEQTGSFSKSINQLEAKVDNVGEQANAFSTSVQGLEKKVGIVDKQTGFFSQAIQTLDKKIDTINAHEKVVSEKMEHAAENDLISTGKAEALVSHAENLLTQVSSLADKMEQQKAMDIKMEVAKSLDLSMPKNLSAHLFQGGSDKEIRYH